MVKEPNNKKAKNVVVAKFASLHAEENAKIKMVADNSKKKAKAKDINLFEQFAHAHHAEEKAKMKMRTDNIKNKSKDFIDHMLYDHHDWLKNFDKIRDIADKYAKDMYKHNEFATRAMHEMQNNIGELQGNLWQASAKYYTNLLAVKNFDDLLHHYNAVAEDMQKMYQQFQLNNSQIHLDICNKIITPAINQATNCMQAMCECINLKP